MPDDLRTWLAGWLSRSPISEENQLALASLVRGAPMRLAISRRAEVQLYGGATLSFATGLALIAWLLARARPPLGNPRPAGRFRLPV